MNFDFERILFYATVITGVIYLLDILFFARKRKQAQKEKMPLIIDYSRSFFPILLLVFLLRSFIAEPFRIPSGSLEPTLLAGDLILVNKFDYGLRLPLTHQRLYGASTPKRGDIMVFRWPPDPRYNFIKRVIGLPGDKISYINKELYVNGQKIPQDYLKDSTAQDERGTDWRAIENVENLLGIKHHIFLNPDRQSRDFNDIEVPQKMYFVMGDNRDDSADSRFWGFVPDENIVGRALVVWLSWNSYSGNLFSKIRWQRIGTIIR